MRRETRLRLLEAGVAATGLLAAAMVLFMASDALAVRGLPGGGVSDYFVAFGRLFGALTGVEMLGFRFVWYTFAVGTFIGIVGPLIGVYIVHREMALIGETLAHTAFAGVAFGLLVASATGWGLPLLGGALVTAILGAFLVQYLAERTESYGDVPIAIILTGSFAVGTIVISYGGGFSGLNIHSYLFGNIGFVTVEGAWLMVLLSAVVLAVVATQYKQLLFITFDEQAARVAQFDVSLYNTLLVVLTALVVVGAMQIMGVILVAAMLVVPVAAASQVADSFRETLYLSVLVGELSVLLGLTLAYTQSLAGGGTVVMVAIACYAAAIVFSDRAAVSVSLH